MKNSRGKKSLSFQDMITSSFKSSDVVNQIAPIIAPSIAELLKPFVHEAIATCVSTTLDNTIEQVKADLIAPIKSTLDEDSVEIATLKRDITKQNHIIESLSSTIASKENEIVKLKQNCEKLASGLNELEQYGRRSSLRFFNVPLKENESTDTKIVDICNKMMNVNITENDIERSHILNPAASLTSNQIIVRFKAYKTKVAVFSQKKLVKGKDVFVTEDLTKSNHAIVRELLKLRKANRIISFWTVDTKIYVRRNEGERATRIRNMEQLNDF